MNTSLTAVHKTDSGTCIVYQLKFNWFSHSLSFWPLKHCNFVPITYRPSKRVTRVEKTLSSYNSVKSKTDLKRFTKTIKYQSEFEGINTVSIGNTTSKLSTFLTPFVRRLSKKFWTSCIAIPNDIYVWISAFFSHNLTFIKCSVLQQSFGLETSAVILK